MMNFRTEKDVAIEPEPVVGRFGVWCSKFDGSQALFKAYSTRTEAEMIVKALAGAGCPAYVVESDPEGVPDA